MADGNYTYTTRPDGGVVTFGDSNDLRIWRDPIVNNSYIRNYDNDLIIETVADDGDIIFKSDDGSGGSATYFYLDGGGVLTRAVKNIITNDGVKFQAGSSGDLEMFHDGSNSYIENYTGDFIFTQALDDGDMIFKSDNGSGGTTPYFSLDGGNTRTNIHKAFRFDDTIKCEFGNSGDLQIRHDGTNSEVVNLTGNLTFQNLADDKDIIFQSDDGSGGFATYFRVDGGAVETRFLKSTRHFDNVGAYFGDSADLQIFHNGSHSYIKDIGTGSLYLQTNGAAIYLQDTDGNAMAQFTDGGGNFLFYNANLKLSTTNTGVTVTGAVTATTFLGDLNCTINTATTAVTKANATNDTTVATTAFVQNLIGTIPAGLVFQGTWNASTNTPTLASGSGTTGHLYIVSTDGSTNLDGITDWKVGDWAVFVEQGASDQWEKVDNSSVLDGSGTGQTVALWSGSGTSNTLTNAPITVSGNDSTFSGNVTIDRSTDGSLIFESSNASKFLVGYDSNPTGFRIYNYVASNTALFIDATNSNATFAGTVNVDSDFKVRGSSGEDHFVIAPQAAGTGTYLISYNGAETGYEPLRIDAESYNFTNAGTSVISTSGLNTTFAGNVILGTGDSLYLNGTTGLRMLHDGTNALFINQTAGDFKIQNSVSDKDIIFKGKDGASTITALTLDMSEGGNATFSGDVITTDGSDTATLSKSGLTLSRGNSYIQSDADNSDTLNIGQSSVRWGHVKVDGADFAVLNGGNERFKIDSTGNATFAGEIKLQLSSTVQRALDRKSVV